MISTHLYLYKHVLNDMAIHLFKERRKIETFKFTYLSNYLTKIMKQKIYIFKDEIIQKNI
jgi:hypothetical protein